MKPIWLIQAKARRVGFGEMPRAVIRLADECHKEAEKYCKGDASFRNTCDGLSVPMFPYDAAIKILSEVFGDAPTSPGFEGMWQRAIHSKEMVLLAESKLKQIKDTTTWTMKGGHLSSEEICDYPSLEQVADAECRTLLHVELVSRIDDIFCGWEPGTGVWRFYNWIGEVRQSEIAGLTAVVRERSLGETLMRVFTGFSERRYVPVKQGSTGGYVIKVLPLNSRESNGFALVLQLTCYLFSLEGKADRLWSEGYLEWIRELVEITRNRQTDYYPLAADIRCDGNRLLSLVKRCVDGTWDRTEQILLFAQTKTARRNINSPLKFREPLAIAIDIVHMSEGVRSMFRAKAIACVEASLPELADNLKQSENELQLYTTFLCLATNRFKVKAPTSYIRTIFKEDAISPETGYFYVGQSDRSLTKKKRKPLAILFCVLDTRAKVEFHGFYCGSGRRRQLGIRGIVSDGAIGLLATDNDDVCDYLYVTGDGKCYYTSSEGEKRLVVPPICFKTDDGANIKASVYPFDEAYPLFGPDTVCALSLYPGAPFCFETVLPGESDADMARYPRQGDPLGEETTVFFETSALAIQDTHVSRVSFEVSLDSEGKTCIKKRGNDDSVILFPFGPKEFLAVTRDGIRHSLWYGWDFMCTDSAKDVAIAECGFVSSLSRVLNIEQEWLNVCSETGFGVFAYNPAEGRSFPEGAHAFLFEPDENVEEYNRLTKQICHLQEILAEIKGRLSKRIAYGQRQPLMKKERCTRVELRKLEGERLLLVEKIRHYLKSGSLERDEFEECVRKKRLVSLRLFSVWWYRYTGDVPS